MRERRKTGKDGKEKEIKKYRNVKKEIKHKNRKKDREEVGEEKERTEISERRERGKNRDKREGKNPDKRRKYKGKKERRKVGLCQRAVVQAGVHPPREQAPRLSPAGEGSGGGVSGARSSHL